MEQLQGRFSRHRKGLVSILMRSLVILAAEVAGVVLSHSLALLADAGHIFTDVVGVSLSLGAVWLATRPAGAKRSFGYYRAEILATIANGILLLGIAGFVLWETGRRLSGAPEVEGSTMLVVAIIGVLGNGYSLWLLRPMRHESLNMRAAYLEVLSDLVGSVAVVIAAVVIWTTGFAFADVIASVVLVLLIIPRTVQLSIEALHILLEGSPKEIRLDQVRSHMLSAEGVLDVHDLHVWSITSGMNVVSAHVVVADQASQTVILERLAACLGQHFNIEHSTFQLETRERMHLGSAFHQ